MSEIETIPAPPSFDVPTGTDNERPADPPEFSFEDSDAPGWGKDLYRRCLEFIEETRETKAQMAASTEALTGGVDRMLATMKLVLHESQQNGKRLGLIEERLVSGDRRLGDHDREIKTLQKRVDTLEAELSEVRLELASLVGDGK